MQTVLHVLATDPQHYGARRLCAYLHEVKKEYAQAEELWNRPSTGEPGRRRLLWRIWRTDAEDAQSRKAGRLAQEGLRHEPDHPVCLYVGAIIDVISSGSRRGQQSEHLLRLLQAHPEQVSSRRRRSSWR
ncbi:MAG: hypothetical protein WDO68_20735 [Gammaproteobacteria bacterium]